MEPGIPRENNIPSRLALFSRFTNNPEVIQELATYTENQFLPSMGERNALINISDEPHVQDWRQYAEEAKSKTVFEVLKRSFVQLNFPIQQGMSKNPNYLNALFKGHKVEAMPEAKVLPLLSPEKLEITFMDGPVGSLPALIVDHPNDFEMIIQSLLHKNEPVDVPPSMGAMIIKGINNWNRLRKVIYELHHNSQILTVKSIFEEIYRKKKLYQDTFVLVSKKPYSNVQPQGYGLEEWKGASVNIRLHHEYAHYFTSRFFGSMKNNMHDELLADYLGIHAIKPNFDTKLFLLFVGLENYPKYRKGGRLENYLGTPQLSEAAVKVLHSIVVMAAHQIESFDKQLGTVQNQQALFNRLIAIASLHLEEIAAPSGLKKLLHQYSSVA